MSTSNSGTRRKILSVTNEPDLFEIVPIVGHLGYFIANDGSAYSIKGWRRKNYWHKLKPQPDQDGYLHVNPHGHTIKVQRLVALHFIGPKPKGMVVCHNDGNKLNNRVGNLRYGTAASNVADTKAHGHENPPRGAINGMSKLTEDNVREIRRLRQEDSLSHSVIAKLFKVSREQVRDICNRKYWRHV